MKNSSIIILIIGIIMSLGVFTIIKYNENRTPKENHKAFVKENINEMKAWGDDIHFIEITVYEGDIETYLYVAYNIKYGDEVSSSFVVVCKSDHHYIYKGTIDGLNKDRYDAFIDARKNPKKVVYYNLGDLK